MKNLLEIEHLTKTYITDASQNTILQDVNLSVKEHEFLCILGSSGCGKTTLLRCIAGFENYEGNITVAGCSATSPSTERIMVFQDFNQLFPWKTVEKNITYALKRSKKFNKETIRTRTSAYLEKVNLTQYKDYYPFQLSGGMKQRTAIAKALALKPQIVLMDEPFASLDAISRRNLQTELLNINQTEKMTTIFVTHNIQEALILGTRILVLGKNGRCKMDIINKLKKPVTPASPEYSNYWQSLYDALEH